ncbi:MAG: cupredoxin domain-containing protein [Chloroflexota bacterium]|nr:cupredoxin domain-containing protein [Chloroflexota bacterium]
MKTLITLAAASVLALAACGATPVAKSGATADGTVNATATDTRITIDKSSIKAGAVTFTLKNTGTVTHELVVVKTNVAQDKLAANPDEAGKVTEDGSLGESGDVEKGISKSFTLDLTPGNYVLMCNEVGHYGMGMHIAFVVN